MENIRVGIVGLGRLGKVHAKNLSSAVSGCELTAACSLVESELAFAQKELGVISLFTNFMSQSRIGVYTFFVVKLVNIYGSSIYNAVFLMAVIRK